MDIAAKIFFAAPRGAAMSTLALRSRSTLQDIGCNDMRHSDEGAMAMDWMWKAVVTAANAKLKMEHDLLKEAAAYFAKESM
jgi:hypothetical protein